MQPEVLRLMADTGRSYEECDRALMLTGGDHWDADALLWVGYENYKDKRDDGRAYDADDLR